MRVAVKVTENGVTNSLLLLEVDLDRHIKERNMTRKSKWLDVGIGAMWYGDIWGRFLYPWGA